MLVVLWNWVRVSAPRSNSVNWLFLFLSPCSAFACKFVESPGNHVLNESGCTACSDELRSCFVLSRTSPHPSAQSKSKWKSSVWLSFTGNDRHLLWSFALFDFHVCFIHLLFVCLFGFSHATRTACSSLVLDAVLILGTSFFSSFVCCFHKTAPSFLL